MNKKWLIKNVPDPSLVREVQDVLKIDEVIAQLLVQRGILNFDQAQQFFRPQLSQLHDPFLMKNMEQAVHRLKTAIDNQQKVLLYGDYDVDGTSAVALLWDILHPLLPQIAHFR